ncbi:MAG: type IV pili methyl-accepting chemotaxis transducer N-terminal domain-containing protein [Burkholderiales bacterium]|nr:type IV pili methyl-accepting chemotaxis transducer N-terminal domain-containing protein [Burkholderiales bacterium]
MIGRTHWTLASTLSLVAAPFVVLGIASFAATLWISWQLDGGAAAVNEAGRMRMQVKHWALAVALRDEAELATVVADFERGLDVLRTGDPERPLALPADATIAAHVAAVAAGARAFRERWGALHGSDTDGLLAQSVAFTAEIDALVDAIERHVARWTALLHLLQITMMALAVIGGAVLLVTGYLFILDPVGRFKQATTRIAAGDFGARVHGVTTDELGSLAECFNGMAAHLQSLYRDLEARVADKTSQLEEKHERLEALYAVTALASDATTLTELAHGFAQRVARVARADGVAVRWVDEDSDEYVLLATEGLPQTMAQREQCVHAGRCFCGTHAPTPAVRVIAVRDVEPPGTKHCAVAGYASIVSLPIRLHERRLGEVDLFYHAHVTPTPAERSLLEALTAHLAAAMENLRLAGLEREAAVTQERAFIARELHDSIAQVLAFIKLQVGLMRDAVAAGDLPQARKVLHEIDTGVRECYGDVRELLVHFRTRPQGADIEPALRTTLRKFEHQSGLAAHLALNGHGLPLAPDVQIQVLHIVQEALSNVRKHAHAESVRLIVERTPAWRFEVRDDGVGFAVAAQAGEDHVGLRIMHERAEKIGATLEIDSAPGRGTAIVLTLPRETVPVSEARLAASAGAGR